MYTGVVAIKHVTQEAEPLAIEHTCGIIMPISSLDGCPEEHWSDVLEIIQTSIETAGFKPNLVSNADEVGIIQKRIIQNLYDNPIAVCDVSGKNPNCMFELGLRLAFDKPTIIVKDDKTTYSFDTAPIEHIEYPRDLRYASIVEFKQILSEKISSTHKKAKDDPHYTTFLKNFGTFTIAKLDTKEVDKEEFILDELRSLRQLLLARSGLTPKPISVSRRPSNCLCLRNAGAKLPDALVTTLITRFRSDGATVTPMGSGHFHITFLGDVPFSNFRKIVESALEFVPEARWLGPAGRSLYSNRRDAKTEEKESIES
jgi:hypothetical protein